MRYSFSKAKRIRRSPEFTRIIRLGACAADGTLVVFASAQQVEAANPGDSQLAPARIGITIPKKTGNAVKRNRWKRLIRESFRTQVDRIPAGYDYIVRPKKGGRPDWNNIRMGLPKLAKRAANRCQSTPDR